MRLRKKTISKWNASGYWSICGATDWEVHWSKNTIIKLSSKSKKTNIVGLERVAKSKEALPATGKLTWITSKRAERQNYFVQGTYDLEETFRKRKKGSTEYYNKTYR